MLDLRQQHADEPDVLRQVRLRHHDDVDPVAGLSTDLDQIAIGERRVEAVDAERLELAAEVELLERADDVGAARRLSSTATASSRSMQTASASLAAAFSIMFGRDAGT
jgi:hypothetical protein